MADISEPNNVLSIRYYSILMTFYNKFEIIQWKLNKNLWHWNNITDL